MMLKAAAFSAAVASAGDSEAHRVVVLTWWSRETADIVHACSLCLRACAAAFSPAAVPALRAKTALCANKFGQQAPPDAPPADLFNIWRDDYMLTPAEAAAEAAERKKNTLFDGVLPPFSNIGNTERGDVEGLFRVDDSTFILADSGKGHRHSD